MRTKEEILSKLDYRPTRGSYRNDDMVLSRSVEAICEVLLDIRDLLTPKQDEK